jgi:hypothetical protein
MADRADTALSKERPAQPHDRHNCLRHLEGLPSCTQYDAKRFLTVSIADARLQRPNRLLQRLHFPAQALDLLTRIHADLLKSLLQFSVAFYLHPANFGFDLLLNPHLDILA